MLLLSNKSLIGISKCLVWIIISKINQSRSLSTTPSYGQTTRNVATQTLQGTGPIPDPTFLNKYNLNSLELIKSEWNANFVTKVTEKESNVYLGVKSNKDLYVDTITYTFPRLAENPGLGLELEEIASNESLLGITIISSVIEDGPAFKGLNFKDTSFPPIMPGDVLSQVSLIRRGKLSKSTSPIKSINEIEEESTIRTECLSYDATVEALKSLPTPNFQQFEDYYKVVLKRIRRKPIVNVKLRFPPDQNEPDQTIQLYAGENLRQGMLVRGVKLNDPLAKRFDTKTGGNCGAGGLCRTCIVSVLAGSELLNPQRVAESQILADNPRYRLSCKAIVGYGMKEGDLTINVSPRQWDVN
jgi:ferredoxin